MNDETQGEGTEAGHEVWIFFLSLLALGWGIFALPGERIFESFFARRALELTERFKILRYQSNSTRSFILKTENNIRLKTCRSV